MGRLLSSPLFFLGGDNMILGLDCSTKSTGWCRFDGNRLIDYGCIKANDSDCIERIRYMIDEISKLIKKNKPDVIIQEDVPPSIQNSMTVKQLSTLKGGVLALSCIHEVPISYVLPNVWQSALKILRTKGSTKQQSVNYVNEFYGTNFVYAGEKSTKSQDDITDSICLVHYFLRGKDK